MILSIKAAVSSCRCDLCNERHVSGWLINTHSASVSVSMSLQSSAARDLPWSECSLIQLFGQGPS